jgi:septum formation protein
MLLDLLERLPSLRLVLASQSPRRREILSHLIGPAGSLEILPSTFAEDLPKGSSAISYVQLTARKKAEEVVAKLVNSPIPAGRPKEFILISTDTVVVRLNKILEKPADEDHAFEMLSSLSGGVHSVVSGVTVVTNLTLTADSRSGCDVPLPASLVVEPFHVEGSSASDLTVAQFASETTVEFSPIPESVLRLYCKTKEPYDKAGGYGIQSLHAGAQFVKRIEGEYSNVMGLPVSDLCAVLRWIIKNGKAKDAELS